MSFYGDLQADLAELFADEPFLPATIKRTIAGSFDPIERTTVGSTVSIIPCRAMPDEVTVVAMDGSRTKYTTILANVPMIIGDDITCAGVAYNATSTSGNSLTGLYEATVAG